MSVQTLAARPWERVLNQHHYETRTASPPSNITYRVHGEDLRRSLHLLSFAEQRGEGEEQLRLIRLMQFMAFVACLPPRTRMNLDCVNERRILVKLDFTFTSIYPGAPQDLKDQLNHMMLSLRFSTPFSRFPFKTCAPLELGFTCSPPSYPWFLTLPLFPHVDQTALITANAGLPWTVHKRCLRISTETDANELRLWLSENGANNEYLRWSPAQSVYLSCTDQTRPSGWTYTHKRDCGDTRCIMCGPPPDTLDLESSTYCCRTPSTKLPSVDLFPVECSPALSSNNTVIASPSNASTAMEAPYTPLSSCRALQFHQSISPSYGGLSPTGYLDSHITNPRVEARSVTERKSNSYLIQDVKPTPSILRTSTLTASVYHASQSPWAMAVPPLVLPDPVAFGSDSEPEVTSVLKFAPSHEGRVTHKSPRKSRREESVLTPPTRVLRSSTARQKRRSLRQMY